MNIETCDRCGGETFDCNADGEVHDHQDLERCVSVLVRYVHAMAERVEQLEDRMANEEG